MPQKTPSAPYDEDALRALLHWYEDMGVDDVVSPTPVDFYENFAADPVTKSSAEKRPQPLKNSNSGGAKPAPRASAKTSISTNSHPSTAVSKASTAKPNASTPTTGVIRPDANAVSPDQAIAQATELAAQSPNITALEQAVRDFNGCMLKKGARNTVFADGIESAPLLVMGEAPGADEDRNGKPFVGRAGLLLDKMLEAIGHNRTTNCYISNIIYWRPPGNRPPSPEEISICEPFAQRLIELAQPKVILLTGATSLTALLGKSGIMKHRGQWQKLTTRNGFECPIMPTFHPAYLLRNPEAKRLVWHDLQKLAAFTKEA